MKPFHVYLLRCSDGSYYCGHTDNLDARLYQHEESETGYTATRKPVTLAWQGEFEKREQALAFERQVKGWSRAKKEALIAGDWQKVSGLAKSRQASSDTLSAIQSSTSSDRTELGRTVYMVSDLTQEDAALVKGVLAQERRALAKTITLLESTRSDHRERGQQVLDALLPHAGRSIRIGISGVPGVGKSTFIEMLGMLLIKRGHRVAVLAIDPSSSISGGSILGDKTRMDQLSMREEAFIRPSPASGSLGGVADKTREAMLVCEAAGFNIVIVETVGVGQSETAVAGMTDVFVLLQLPNAGDDLQAIKKGIVELADVVVFNKADIDIRATEMAVAQMQSALSMLRPATQYWKVPVLQTSATRQQGIDEFWNTIEKYREAMEAHGAITARRQQQALAWMWHLIETGLHQRFNDNPGIKQQLPTLAQAVQAGTITPSAAARQLLGSLNT